MKGRDWTVVDLYLATTTKDYSGAAETTLSKVVDGAFAQVSYGVSDRYRYGPGVEEMAEFRLVFENVHVNRIKNVFDWFDDPPRLFIRVTDDESFLNGKVLLVRSARKAGEATRRRDYHVTVLCDRATTVPRIVDDFAVPYP